MFSTKGQEVKEGGVSKSFQPGIVYARIFSAQVRTSSKGDKKCLELILESEPIDDFEGWPIDRDNPEGPKHHGLIGRVAATIWTENFNEPNVAKNEIMYKLTVIASEMGRRDVVDNVSASTLEEWVGNVVSLLKDTYAYWFLVGKEEEYNGKKIVKLSLPKYKFVNSREEKLDKFDRNNKYHYRSLEQSPVKQSFEATNEFEV